ncbi:MAG TPA: hypothetical protein VF221_01460 [Chloroflexota bacterium]
MGFELADDSMWGQNGRRRDGDIHPVREDSYVVNFDSERLRLFADEISKPLCGFSSQTGFRAHWCPHEVVGDALFHV